MKVVFLDRDGVINKFPGHGTYVMRLKDLHLIPASLEAIRELTQAGFKIFVISNQAGVGRGLFTQQKLKAIDTKMINAVEAAGGKIQQSFYCTHHPNVGCDCRKPGIGLIKLALKSINKSLSQAKGVFFVGDTESDIKTGINAGCKTIFVLTGRDGRRQLRQWPIKPDYIVNDLKGASRIIQDENSSRSRHRRSRA
jgi:D-glycero-D-manno-heptose 1,7-bisphosphate phosphatase